MSQRLRGGRALLAGPVVLAVLLAAGCGSDAPSAATSTTAPSSTSTSTTAAPTTTAPSPTTTAPSRTTTSRPRKSPIPTRTATGPTTTATPSSHTTASKAATKPTPKPVPRPTATTTKPRPTPAAATCRIPAGVSAAQVVLVDSSGSSATVRACRRSGGRYLLDLGPYYGHVGRNGVSWSKREGDLKTPAGTYPLLGGFGVRGNPGLVTGWFRVDGNDVWVDDSASSLYNTHQRRPVDGRWSSAENLYNTKAYNYAQVVGYNQSRTPGKGSAIFFHVDTGGGTAGCVSLPADALLAVMRWERSGAVMSIR
ncbi:hypothetical protein ABEG17_09945 [Pedococcus sp. KACC 23699]|uniref:L,D-transpeptidase family protein n=1 Tax=Pedococcus sp. KACC 23699 TaxID=3149228 RepID=A0AAU7JNN6_9MICO